MNTEIINAAAEIIKNTTFSIESSDKKFDFSAINIETSSRMTKTWGYMSYNKMTDEYTMKISEKVYGGKTDTVSFKNTVLHELAHALEHFYYGKFSHSNIWKAIMITLGGDPHRCVTSSEKKEVGFVSKRRRNVRYAHKCGGGCIHNLSGQKHHRLLAGAVYTCNKTGKKLLKSFTVSK